MVSNDCPVPFTCEISETWKGTLCPRNARPSSEKVFISAGIWSLLEKALKLVGESYGTFIKHLNIYSDWTSAFLGSFAYPYQVGGKKKAGFTTKTTGFELWLALHSQVPLFLTLS